MSKTKFRVKPEQVTMYIVFFGLSIGILTIAYGINNRLNKKYPPLETSPTVVKRLLVRGEELSNYLQSKEKDWTTFSVDAFGEKQTYRVGKDLYETENNITTMIIPKTQWETFSENDRKALIQYAATEKSVDVINICELIDGNADKVPSIQCPEEVWNRNRLDKVI